ncbi:MAG: TIGR02680 family protein [Nitriliruptoraceae bacterium]
MTVAPRFRPTRAGVIGLWDYRDAAFAFADGRLVLRGANGSGKTKALEVLFPFVLDGRLDPRRLDPFSGENRTMKANLLWRGGDVGHGYAWLEFARPTGADGTIRYVTVGVGLQAQRHRPSPRSWFFVTDGRVGEDLVLVDPDGRPRTKKALAAALGDGVVLERASEHRRRVDEVLFGLGPERYEAMLDLVLTLRRPMLAKDLDPKSLSETLSRGLRPLDEDLIEQVARSFDDLEAVQRDLDRLIAADEATAAFVTDYRGYLRTQARYRADRAIDAVADQRAAEQRRDAAAQALDGTRAEEAMAEAEATAIDVRLATGRARRDALKASDAFRTAAQLQHLEQAVRDLEEERQRAEVRASHAVEAATQAAADHQRAADDLRRADAEVARLVPRVLSSATAAGVVWTEEDGAAAPEEVRQRIAGRAAARHADLDAVREALDALHEAERRVASAEAAQEAAETAEGLARAHLDEAERASAAARTALQREVDEWAAAQPVVTDEDGAALRAAVERLGEETAPSLLEVWSARLEPRRSAAALERATHRTTAGALAEQGEVLRGRRQAIAEERDDAPPPPVWRRGDRLDRAGAPLWRLVRFADDLAPARAAAVEAALEAAGLLDAWVHSDGRVGHDEHDSVLIAVPSAAGGPPAVGGSRTLAEVLVPETQDHVAPQVVARLLSAVAVSDGPAPGSGDEQGDAGPAVSVTLDGRYRLGPLAGHHRVDAPRYIGATARAAHRAARIAALDAELAELDAEAARTQQLLDEVEAWLATADQATVSLPATSTLVTQLRQRDIAIGRQQQARQALADATAAAEAARRAVNDRRRAFQDIARARALPASRDGLAQVAAALGRFETDGSSLAAGVSLALDRQRTAAAAAARTEQAEGTAEAARADARARRQRRDARQVELTTLQERMGSDVQAVLEELHAVEDDLRTAETDRATAQAHAREAAARRGQAEGEVRAAGEALTASGERVQAAQRRLTVLGRDDLAGPLGLDVPDDADPDTLLEAVDRLVVGVSGAGERRKAAQTRITRSLEELDHALGSGYRPSWDVEDDLIVVTIADDLGERSVAAFATELTGQRADQEALLTARERAVFEDALLTSVCGQIHHRTQATRDLVSAMDAQMRARRLSSGHTVGVAWRAEDAATAEWKRVHRLLDQDPAHFGPDQLEALRRHFSQEIKAARAAHPQTPYRELLAEVLDYRRWRRFELFLVEADGSQALLTRARHARLSGGEKAASLHLPLFAAAHAAFAAGSPTCPRLLALDEAFAGIDDQGRSELLSLSVAFDLDLFMTGFDLWAVDRAVPGVAHYDLLHLADEHAVSSLLILWTGEELVEGPDAEVELARTWTLS